MVPALANVWTMGFFAYGCELMGVNGCANLLITLATANADSQPRWFSFSVQHFIVFVLTALHAIFYDAKALGSFELVAAFDLAQVSFRMNV